MVADHHGGEVELGERDGGGVEPGDHGGGQVVGQDGVEQEGSGGGRYCWRKQPGCRVSQPARFLTYRHVYN